MLQCTLYHPRVLVTSDPRETRRCDSARLDCFCPLALTVFELTPVMMGGFASAGHPMWPTLSRLVYCRSISHRRDGDCCSTREAGVITNSALGKAILGFWCSEVWNRDIATAPGHLAERPLKRQGNRTGTLPSTAISRKGLFNSPSSDILFSTLGLALGCRNFLPSFDKCFLSASIELFRCPYPQEMENSHLLRKPL